MPKPRPSIPTIIIDEDASKDPDESRGSSPETPETPPDGKNHLAAQPRASRGSFSEEARRLTMKASELIIHVPVEQIRKIREGIGETESMNSISRETEHFVGITTVHGPLRVYRGKGYYRWLWALALSCCVGLFLYQFSSLFQNFVSKPTVSQVSFILPEDGLTFPAITICNYNPIRKSYINRLNATHGFSEVLLDYLIQSYVDVQTLVETASEAQLFDGEVELEKFKEFKDFKDFNINGFFKNAGFACEEIFKLCSFGGKQFKCCDYAKATLTDMGKCFRIDLGNAQKEWMRVQTAPGVGNGLQIIADFHKEEQIGTGQEQGLEPLFMNEFENGFRYFVHSRETIPYLATEGISVSPGARVYSALSPQKFVLLDESSWGNCTSQWPSNYKTTVPYSATNCKALCRAKFFDDQCGCSPFIYNIGGKYDVCTPYQIFHCVKRMLEEDNDTVDGYTKLRLPQCAECKVECESWLFHTFNSYGSGFSEGALKWLERKNENWTAPHVKANFVTMNIFFRDMSFTQYVQVQSVSLTQTFSDIGGNMGMFMGMSLLSIIEVVIWLSKISWVAISKKRRHYLVDKKSQERERERRLEETLTQKHRSATECTDDSLASAAREKLKRLAGSFRRKSVAAFDGMPSMFSSTARIKKDRNFDEDYADAPETAPPPSTPQSPRSFMDNFLENNLHGAGRATRPNTRKTTPNDQMLELKIDLNQLAKFQKDPSTLQENLAKSLVARPKIVSMRSAGAPAPQQLGAGGRRRSTSVAFSSPSGNASKDAPSLDVPRMGRRRSYSTSSAYTNPAFETIPEGRETPSPAAPGSTVAALMGMMPMMPPMREQQDHKQGPVVPPRMPGRGSGGTVAALMGMMPMMPPMPPKREEEDHTQSEEVPTRTEFDIPEVSITVNEVPVLEPDSPSDFLTVPEGSRVRSPPEENNDVCISIPDNPFETATEYARIPYARKRNSDAFLLSLQDPQLSRRRGSRSEQGRPMGMKRNSDGGGPTTNVPEIHLNVEAPNDVGGRRVDDFYREMC